MATNKTTAAKAADKKVETKAAAPAKVAEVKAEVKEVKAEVATTEVKAEAKKAPAAKKAATTKKATTAKKTTTTKKATTKKAAAPKAEKKTTAKKAETKVLVQFAGREVDIEAIIESAKADYVANGGKKTAVKNVTLYVKPEDFTAYYVIEGTEGKVNI